MFNLNWCSLFLFLLFLNSYYPAFGQDNLDSIIIQNNVREVRILDNQNRIASLTKYDSLGNLTFRSWDDFTGQTSLKSSITKIYDEKGNNIKTIFTHSAYEEPEIWISQYDVNNNEISTKDINGNLIFEYFYDDLNFMVKKISYDDEELNTIRNIETIEKLENGKKIVSKITKDSIKFRINTTYLDDSGNVIRSDSYDGDVLNSSTIYTYDLSNKLIKTIYLSKYGSNYIYNLNGQLSKRQQFKIEEDADIPTNFEEYEYNDLGLIEKYRENIYSKNLKEYHYEYEFYK